MTSLRSAVAWGLVALAAGFVFARTALPNIAPASDLWDYSQEARQLARGEGFTSLYTYPVFLGQDQPPFPVRWRMPLFAVVGALLLRLGVALPAGFLYFGAFAHAFLVALTYVLGARLFSPRAGTWAAAGALACPLLLDFYSPGMSQAPAAALGLLVWILLLGSGGVRAGVLAGLAAAAAWYLRGEAALFVPLWLWIAARGGRSRAVAFLAVYAALCLPWFLAARAGGGTIQGNPMLLYTSEYPGYSSSRTLGVHLPGMIEYVLAHPGAFALRFAKDLVGYGIDLLDGLGPIVLAGGFVGIAVSGSGRARAIVRKHAPLVLAIVLQVLAMSALERSPRFLVPVVPLALVLIGGAAERAMGRLGRGLAVLVLSVALERGVHVLHQRGDAARRFPPVPVATAAALETRARDWPARGLVLSDAPDWVAWHLDRPALLLPLRSQVDSLAAAREVAAIWLSPEARSRNVADRDTAWVGTMDRKETPAGFSGPEGIIGGSSLYTAKPR